MDLFCVFYDKEVAPHLHTLISLAYGLADDQGVNQIILDMVQNYESQLALWSTLLCGGNG